MSNSSNLAVIEGVDGVGKTTLAKLLAKRNRYKYFYTPLAPLSKIRREVEGLNDFNSRFYYYLAATIAAQVPLREFLNGGSKVIVDRYIYSTFATHQALGVNTQIVEFKKLPIIWPDRVILLSASSEIREKRRITRDEQTDYDRQIEQSPGILNKAQNIFKQLDGLIEIETSQLGIEEVYQRAISLLLEV